MARRGNHTLEQIKEMVIEAAEDLVEQGGVNQLRVRNIAIKIGYTVGSIYMVFRNMNDLILHIKGRTLDAICDEMDQVSSESPAQALQDLAEIYVNFAHENLNRWSMVFEQSLPDKTEAPEWYRNKLDRLYRKFEERLAAIYPQMPAGQRKWVTLSLLGGVHGICILLLTTPMSGYGDAKSLDLCVRHLVKRFTMDFCPETEIKSDRVSAKKRKVQDLQPATNSAG
jgi:AcrR family transcriptional regulator